MKNLRWLTLVSIVIIIVNTMQGATPDSKNAGVLKSKNSLPSTQNDTIILVTNNTVIVPVLANDSGLEDGGLILKTLYNPVFGNAIVNLDNTITYIPESDYSGIDLISYEVCDANDDCSVGYIIIIVDRKNDPSMVMK